MILPLILGLFASIQAFSKVENKCPLSLNWQIKKEGTLSPQGSSGATDFIFLAPDSILVANFPEKGKEQAPLHIYKKTPKGWVFDQAASAVLPVTYHPRQIIAEDLDGDKVKEIIIADHGTDLPPFPGTHPVILKNTKGKWSADLSSKSMGSDFTFNVAVLKLADGKKAIYKANVAGKKPFFFSFSQGKWTDSSDLLPKELGPYNLCFMTALALDFDKDGVTDLYLGGCDRENLNYVQEHDRILSFQKNKWALQPQEVIPARKLDSRWGSVFVKNIDLNSDKKPDLLVASHDFGFHFWKVVAYENLSTPGKFNFKEITVPLNQEINTEGYLNSIEDFSIEGYGLGMLAEVRSVIRDIKKTFPKMATRLLVQNKKEFIDASACIPENISRTNYQFRKFPDDPRRVLLVPFQGDILSLKVSRKK